MALRVLLADESATIKKVIQLALQDFGVEVKSVPVGSDVLLVAKSFMPDVVFADVLLTKRNGYEVCGEIKNDPDLTDTPVILMWSGFMELDQGKVMSNRVDRCLEKPFDPEQLRNVIKELVPRLQTNQISNYLSFPDRPEFLENQQASQQSATSAAAEADQPDIFSSPGDEEEDFKHVPLPRKREPGGPSRDFGAPREQDDWSQADLAQFRVGSAGQDDEIPLPEIDENVDDSPIVWSSTGEEVAIHNFDQPRSTGSDLNMGLSRTAKSTAKAQIQTEAPSPTKSSHSQISDLSLPNLDFERAEQILREQSREVLETIAWRILPDIAERIVREELQKLLKDSERLDEI